MLEARDVVKLDNNIDYVVVSKIQHTDGKTYYYLLEVNGTNTIICYERNDELVEVQDPELNSTLIDIFAKTEYNNLTPEEKEIVEGCLKDLSNVQE